MNSVVVVRSISRSLFLSEKTVRNYVSMVLAKIHVATRAEAIVVAREAGLEPLADALAADPSLTPDTEAAKYVDADKHVPDVAAALEGARWILMERFAENATLVGDLREWLWTHGQMQSKVVAGKEQDGAKFRDYFDAKEPIAKLPSHRALALLRGRREGIVRLALTLDDTVASADTGGIDSRRFNSWSAFSATAFGRPAFSIFALSSAISSLRSSFLPSSWWMALIFSLRYYSFWAFSICFFTCTLIRRSRFMFSISTSSRSSRRCSRS